MASGDSDRDALSKLLHAGTVAEYESEFVILATRVTGMSESLLTYYYIAGLKPLLQCALLRSGPTNLGEAFSLARIMEARFEAIAWKKLNIEEKIDIVLSCPSEDIGFVDGSSAIDDVFDIGESNVESMEVHSEFSEIFENKESVEEVVVGGGETIGVGENKLNRVLDEINLSLIKELVIKVLNGRDVSSESLVVCLRCVSFEKSRRATEDRRWVLCYVRRKKKTTDAAIQRRLWDPGITSFSKHHLEGKVNLKEWGMIRI